MFRKKIKTIKYEIILYWSDEDESYIAVAPELSGCMSDGETPEEALENIQIVIEEWIETAEELGRDIPQPKGKMINA